MEPKTATKTNRPDADSIFFDNVNRSYLAKMSDVGKSMVKDKIYEKPLGPATRSRKKIDF